MRLEFVLRYDHCMAMCLDFGFWVWVGYSSPSSPLRKFRDKFTYVAHWLSDLVTYSRDDFPQIRDLKKAQFLWAGLETSGFDHIILFNGRMHQVPSQAMADSSC